MIRYFGFATNADGKWEQMLCTKENPHERTVCEWTGVLYKSFKQAEADVLRLNTLAFDHMMAK